MMPVYYLGMALGLAGLVYFVGGMIMFVTFGGWWPL